MAGEVASLCENRIINQPRENGVRMPMIDLTYERQKRTYEREKRLQVERILMLHSLSGNHRCTFAIQIIEQVGNLHEQSMVSEFESHASPLPKPDDLYQFRLELETELYHLNTVRILATNVFKERVAASISTESVVITVEDFLDKMEVIRDRLSRKMQAMSVGRN
ncbi:hypothetical protein DPMN_050284 [Dreissena polymorpha]|uniref:Uncharacterized protein n=1 Tax=Dreissena polymorpha TaxID=45954 RepID=A0A9D4HL65_DREPO|nr:hypothetical protein DPMN_050284 [Dreissena polymorpha]